MMLNQLLSSPSGPLVALQDLDSCPERFRS